ncbi:hypothetical protein HF086_007557 [Spodoptera exigua]|uniref:Hydroxymethylbilane synthase n=1 Tax=Spodoptera exigua TaxID=7107 RepID=A0A922SLP2_SPOEX|nr:hypothetical protein HF086_007557 [Spodoptera exigua]
MAVKSLAPSGVRNMEILPCAEMKYAVGQGALAVECRSDNTNILNMLAPFNHPETYCRILAERSFLKTLGGGCSAPVGVSTTLKPVDSQFRLSLTGAVWSMDGKTKLDYTLQQTFAQIRRTQKHKLSPTEESECKKVKTDNGESKNEILNPNEVLKDETVGKSVNQDKEDESDNRIFCGLTINTSIPIDVIIKCDNLGKDVANALIEKGALDVMKVTQDIIRSSTVGKSS